MGDNSGALQYVHRIFPILYLQFGLTDCKIKYTYADFASHLDMHFLHADGDFRNYYIFCDCDHSRCRVSCKPRQPRQTDCLTPKQFQTRIKQSVCLCCLCLHVTLDLPWLRHKLSKTWCFKNCREPASSPKFQAMPAYCILLIPPHSVGICPYVTRLPQV